MKFSFSFLHIITLIKERPERIILWLFLVTFIFLSSYLIIGWPEREVPFSLEEIASERIPRKPVAETVTSVNFEDLLIRKPLTHYSLFIRRNPFVRLPGVAGPRPINEENDNELLLPPPELEVILIYRGIIRTPEGPVAFIEGKETTHWAGEGDEVEGWKIIKIDKEEVKLYNEKRKKELILPLGGGPEERERAQRRAEERRRRRQERQPERPGEGDGERFEAPPEREGLLPGLPPVGNRERRR